MRATIAIDDMLFEEAKKLTDVKTKKELINLSLRELIRRKRQEHLAGLYGSGLVDLTVEEVEEFRHDEGETRYWFFSVLDITPFFIYKSTLICDLL